MTVLFALSSAFTTAVYFVYISHVMKTRPEISSSLALAVSHLAGAACLLPFWLTSGNGWSVMGEPSALALLAGIAGLLVISRQLYFYAYAHTDVANITVFSALTPIYALVTGFLLLGEAPSLLSLAGMLLICGSIYGMFLRRRPGDYLVIILTEPFREIVTSKPVRFAFLSTIPTALAATWQKQLLYRLDAVTFSFWLLLGVGLLACLWSLPRQHHNWICQARKLPWGFIATSALLLPMIHVLFCLLMIEQQAATSLVLQRCSIVFQMILAYYFLHERQHIRARLLAGVVIIIGFALVILGS